jgi:hypothetical protein
VFWLFAQVPIVGNLVAGTVVVKAWAARGALSHRQRRNRALPCSALRAHILAAPPIRRERIHHRHADDQGR